MHPAHSVVFVDIARPFEMATKSILIAAKKA